MRVDLAVFHTVGARPRDLVGQVGGIIVEQQHTIGRPQHDPPIALVIGADIHVAGQFIEQFGDPVLGARTVATAGRDALDIGIELEDLAQNFVRALQGGIDLGVRFHALRPDLAGQALGFNEEAVEVGGR